MLSRWQGNPKVCQLGQEKLGEQFASVKGGCKSMQAGRTGARAVSVSFWISRNKLSIVQLL